ncbi:hypothetical protein J5Y04_24920 [Kitasatospora sp. RG8]|uniref:hypothetical protein n=1 Tax=Kitasatospora sp. RG8 TaxID=2820815 RepID=UPI001AE0D170|nr:hypothetical protein [Kitasatospora sp. RG8]MBP0452762.1 hypothetical protein [Kitasatospora sp. RG8]
MEYAPSDVVVRILLELGETRSPAAALRACLPLVAELSPAAVELRHDDDGIGVELLVVLPVPAQDARRDLRAAVTPLAERLGLDPERFEFTGGRTPAGRVRDLRSAGRFGAYQLDVRLGGDPAGDGPPGECGSGVSGPAEPGTEGPTELLPEGPVLPWTDEDEGELAQWHRRSFAIWVRLGGEFAGVDERRAGELFEELLGRVRLADLGPEAVAESTDGLPPADPGAVGCQALLGPVTVAPEAAMAVVRQALAAERGWSAVRSGDAGGPYLASGWTAAHTPGQGLVAVNVLVAEGLVLGRIGAS